MPSCARSRRRAFTLPAGALPGGRDVPVLTGRLPRRPGQYRLRGFDTGNAGDAIAAVSDAGAMGDETDEEWLEPDDQMGLWEYQLHPLTVEWLRESLDNLPDGLPVQVEFYDGSDVRALRPMHIDLKGKDDRPSAIVITVA